MSSKDFVQLTTQEYAENNAFYSNIVGSVNQSVESGQKLDYPTPAKLLNNGYKYLDLIGEGSNGKTYRARNLKTGEIVAIKELKFSDNLKNYELFLREAEVLRSLNMPGIPHYYDYITGEGEFTECWIVQEYIEGKSILEKLEAGEIFSEFEVLDLLREVAEIIKYLQTNYAPPIIHRDIKPSNILIRNNKCNGVSVCLIDFGAVANPQRRSLNSTVAGTVGYMAPEQLMGDCSIQSDYYALGATALHMLMRKPPSELHSDGFKLEFEDALKQACPVIKDSTIALLRKLLAEHASDRPQNADELIHCLKHGVKLSIPRKENLAIQKKLQRNIKIYNHLPDVKNYADLFYYLVGAIAILCIIFGVDVFFAAFGGGILIIIFAFSRIILEKKLKKSKEMYPVYYDIAMENINKEKMFSDKSCDQIQFEPDQIVPGTIVSIVNAIDGEAVEYAYIVDHRSYVGIFINNDKYKKYKLNDRVNVLYKKTNNGVFGCVKMEK